MSKPETFRLQTTYQVLPDSKEARVLAYLLDRDRTTSGQAKEKVMSALLAWLYFDGVRSERDGCSETEYREALQESIATLRAKLTYLESLVTPVGTSAGAGERLGRANDRLSPLPTPAVPMPVASAHLVMNERDGGKDVTLSEPGDLFSEFM